MIFYLHNKAPHQANYYTYGTLRKIIKTYGHALTEDPAAAPVHLVNVCDVTEIPKLARIRASYPHKKIIAGGHFAVNFMALALFADLVNIGQGFDFFKCKTFEEMAALDCVYFKGKGRQLVASTFIDWPILPLVQSNTGLYYYLAAVGCQNKCKFCLTSWTNQHVTNSATRINKAVKMIPANCKINLISNDNTFTTDKSQAVSMMAKDFIKLENKQAAQVIRIGLEFAGEENRRRYGKPISDDLFIECIEHAKKINIELQVFCIGGIDTRQAWIDFFLSLPPDMETHPRIYFKFTNMAYEQFTPIYKDRFNLKLENYLDADFGRQLAGKLTFHNRRIRIWNPIKRPAGAIWRMGMAGVTDKIQYQAWAALRTEHNAKVLYDKLYETGVIKTDYQDRLKFWYQKTGEKNNGNKGKEKN